MKLTFYGGAGDVAGANYILESGNRRIMVDCGLVQEGASFDKRNLADFAYDPASVEALFVTHAHIDHTGRIPKLCRDGFLGDIYSTPPTKDFAELLLLDSEHILAKETARKDVNPIYESADIQQAMRQWHRVKYHEPIKTGPFTVTFYNAGHILGSSIVEVLVEGKKILFSGDLGNYPAPIIQDTESFDFADYVVMESAYGGRVHEGAVERRDILEDVIEETVESGGALLIPAFAMERTQDILFHLNSLVETGKIPNVPVFIDSPLAIKLTYVYQKYEDYFDPDINDQISTGDDIFNFKGLRFTLTTEQSKEINFISSPKIIIAGSGMSTGGRILHHERLYLPDPNSTILFIGYQGRGTLGRAIQEGATTVKIFGEDIPVRAKVRSISGYSAHADQPRLLLWLKPMRRLLKKVFLVQGEKESAEALMFKIRDELAIKAEIPEKGESVML